LLRPCQAAKFAKPLRTFLASVGQLFSNNDFLRCPMAKPIEVQVRGRANERSLEIVCDDASMAHLAAVVAEMVPIPANKPTAA
jgi:hypothetical protein